MKKITFINPHRQRHFEFFNSMSSPHFNITANVDITELMNVLKNKEIVVIDKDVKGVLPILNSLGKATGGKND